MNFLAKLTKLSGVFQGLTVVILAITMWGVLKYACEAKKQSRLLDQSVKQQIESVKQQVLINRPVIMGNGALAVDFTKEKIPSKVLVGIMNFGRSVSPAAVAVGHIFVREVGEAPPVDPECKEGGPWPTEPKLTAIASATENPSRKCSNLLTVLLGNGHHFKVRMSLRLDVAKCSTSSAASTTRDWTTTNGLRTSV